MASPLEERRSRWTALPGIIAASTLLAAPVIPSEAPVILSEAPVILSEAKDLEIATTRSFGPGLGSAPSGRSILLLTLDTTRADALGCYGAPRPTPALDGLAARGVRYSRALTAAPLTLPAHASLLTGLDPPEHGVLDNGTAVLETDVPTLATVLSGQGYATAAFVSSRILDRRFGLGRGFDAYDDRMAAERTGEYGYAERDAATVTSAALAWLKARPAAKPYFLWVHYYDPHAPYEAPGATPAERYAGEVAAMDREIGRLLASLPRQALVAAVGDHGESLGEHGEHGHGLFLYESVLHVPLLLAGPGVPSGRVHDGVVAARRLAPTLLRLLGAPAALSGSLLPGLGLPGASEPVYSETRLPESAYGWSPLRALSEERWRLVEAPRPELYDVAADPAEAADRARLEPAELSRMRRQLESYASRLKGRPSGREPDPAVAEAVRSLGYLSGASGKRAGTIDPKDGIALLAELDDAKALRASGRLDEAQKRLRDLCARSPGNVPFLNQLASVQLASGQWQAATATLRQALDLNPRSDFAHLHLADAYRRLGKLEDARRSYESALLLNPRLAAAWLALAEMANAGGRRDEEYDVLRRAAEAGTGSAALLTRLAQVESARGEVPAADGHLREATTLLPAFAPAWLEWGALAERGEHDADALGRYERAAAADATDPTPFLRLGRLHLRRRETAQARRDLEKAAAARPGSAEAREARRLLATLQP